MSHQQRGLQLQQRAVDAAPRKSSSSSSTPVAHGIPDVANQFKPASYLLSNNNVKAGSPSVASNGATHIPPCCTPKLDNDSEEKVCLNVCAWCVLFNSRDRVCVASRPMSTPRFPPRFPPPSGHNATALSRLLRQRVCLVEANGRAEPGVLAKSIERLSKALFER
jgi:hypothetical protein